MKKNPLLLAVLVPEPDLLVDRPIPLIVLTGSTTSSMNGDSGYKIIKTVIYICTLDLLQ